MVASIEINHTEVRKRASIGPKFEGMPPHGCGLVELPQVVVGQPQVRVAPAVIGSQLGYALKHRYRLLVATLPNVEDPEIVVIAPVLRAELDGFLEALLR